MWLAYRLMLAHVRTASSGCPPISDHHVNNVILFQQPLEWRIPVWIKMGRGVLNIVGGLKKVLNHLIVRWPAECDPHHHNPRRQCLNAMQRRVPVEVVREPFCRQVSRQACLTPNRQDRRIISIS
jgi:hypothetical protein